MARQCKERSIQKIIYENVRKEHGSFEKIPVAILKYYILCETLFRIDDSILQKAAKRVSYNEYLSSPYWKVIKNYLVYIKKQCKICKKTKRLTVHHRTYEHLGIEYKHVEDLDVLCWRCHIEERKINKLPENCYKIGDLLNAKKVY